MLLPIVIPSRPGIKQKRTFQKNKRATMVYEYTHEVADKRPLLRGRAMQENKNHNSNNNNINNNNSNSHAHTANNQHPQETFVLVNKANNNNKNNHETKPESPSGTEPAANSGEVDNFRSEIMSHQFSPPEENVDVHVETWSPEEISLDLVASAQDTNTDTARLPTPTDSNDSPTKDHNNSHAWVVVSLLSVVLLLMVIGLIARCVTRKRRIERKRSREVYEYLWNFDMEDVVVRKAATGGWHGTYKNGLASGENDVKTIVSAKTTKTSGTEESDVVEDEPLVDASPNKKRPIKFRPRVQTDIYLDSEENVFSPL